MLTTLLLVPPAWGAGEPYLIGRGKHDVTGPAAEVGMMGYADPEQIASGVHDRQWARAFVIAERDGTGRIALVIVDTGELFQSISQGVAKKLSRHFGSGLYDERNVLLSATHTHGVPGGASHYALYNITIKGFIQQTYDALVEGIFQAIRKAHEDLKPGRLVVNRGDLYDANANRSLAAYMNNRDAHLYAPVDREMLLLKFVQEGQDIGFISWFPTHGVSMPKTNTLLTGDNKGYAAYLFEREMERRGRKDFVAAFAQSNAGDMTPNLHGDGTGPGATPEESTRIIGARQYEKARELFDSATERIEGPIALRHRYLDLSNVTVEARFADGQPRRTCSAALGYAFFAGTEDGRGLPFFKEGELDGDPFLDWIAKGLVPPTPVDVACHAPKPIFLAVGRAKPYPWSPEVLPITLVQLGQLGLIAVPAEPTVMAGRRLRHTVEAALGGRVRQTVVVSYTNGYSGYVTTREEYELQHYEGGATHFGPWTLAAYRQSFEKLAVSLRENAVPVFAQPGPTPRNLADEQITFQTGVIHDQAPLFKHIGDIVRDAEPSYGRGDTVRVVFWAGHPKNDLRTGGSFLEIEQWDGERWKNVARDDDWSTRFSWKRVDPLWGTSQAILEWDIPPDADLGLHRMVHWGARKQFPSGDIVPYHGVSRVFSVTR